ncbi:MAG: hypothetical protein EAZ99_16335 [Alphaproteobacteria bacterium]|nr:MAG: hypothetical protein EAZ99_16335 [Alphaproteobacteria bacterium]
MERTAIGITDVELGLGITGPSGVDVLRNDHLGLGGLAAFDGNGCASAEAKANKCSGNQSQGGGCGHG